MNVWYKKSFVFVVAGVVYLMGQYFRGVWFLGSGIPNVCGNAEFGGVPFCNSPYLDTLGWPLIILGQVLAVVAVILLFANTDTFRKWFKFSLFYIPITTALALWMYPAHTPLGGVVPISQGAYLFGNLFIIATLIIVVRGFFMARGSYKK